MELLQDEGVKVLWERMCRGVEGFRREIRVTVEMKHHEDDRATHFWLGGSDSDTQGIGLTLPVSIGARG